MHGDALEEMRKLPDESVGVAITSPPYNILNTTGGGFFAMEKDSLWPGNKLCRGYGNPRGDKPVKPKKWSKKSHNVSTGRFTAMHEGYDHHDDAMPHDQYIEWQRECLSEIMRLLHPDGVLAYNHKWRVQDGHFERLADEITRGFPIRQIVIWSRPGSFNSSLTFILHTYEVIYFIPKSKSWKPHRQSRGMGSVWHMNHAQKNPHPAPFPIELPRRCLFVAKDCPGPVLDPFMGSGTTAIAAEQEDREWIGIEKSADYVEMANARIAEEIKTL